ALVERVAVEVAEVLRHRPPHHAVEAGGMGHEDGRSLAAKVPGGHVEAVRRPEGGHVRNLPNRYPMSSCCCCAGSGSACSSRAGSPRSSREISAALSTAWSR